MRHYEYFIIFYECVYNALRILCSSKVLPNILMERLSMDIALCKRPQQTLAFLWNYIIKKAGKEKCDLFFSMHLVFLMTHQSAVTKQ